jgi:hypothetical protein
LVRSRHYHRGTHFTHRQSRGGFALAYPARSASRAFAPAGGRQADLLVAICLRSADAITRFKARHPTDRSSCG